MTDSYNAFEIGKRDYFDKAINGQVMTNHDDIYNVSVSAASSWTRIIRLSMLYVSLVDYKESYH